MTFQNASQDERYVVIAPRGRIDHANAEQFRVELLECVDAIEKQSVYVIFDFDAVQYISSIGLRLLLLISRKLEEKQGKIVFCNLQEPLREVFFISRFNLLFRIFDTRKEAIQAILDELETEKGEE